MFSLSVSEKKKEEIVKYLEKEEADRIAIFGSYTRGEETQKSDIDILVNFSEPKSLLDIVRIERELSETIGIKVDLVTEKSLSPYIKEDVEKEKEVLI